MVPIFYGTDGEGIGHNISEFHDRFNQLCREYLEAGRAKAFALIFYHFSNIELQQILENRGAFAQLDRLSGKQLSVFFLNSESEPVTEYFNSHFQSKLGIAGEVSLPCVAFFKMVGDERKGLRIRPLNSPNTMHGFHELYSILDAYIRTEIGS